MFRTLALLCFITAPAIGLRNGGLKVRFDMNPFGFGSSSFMDIPMANTTAATNKKAWVPKTPPTLPKGLETLTMWCPSDDLTVCVYYDDTGYVAGLNIAVDEENFSGKIFDWEVQGFTRWTAERNGVTKNYWTTQQFYISAESLAMDPKKRAESRGENNVDADAAKLMLRDTHVWVRGFNGELLPISTDTKEIAENSDFTEQACLLWMGHHYYYKMKPDTVCSENTLLPWFPLVYSDQLIGVGLIIFGKYEVEEGLTNWFETPAKVAVQTIVPTGPQCLYDLVDSPGIVTMHTYFIDYPYDVLCVFE